MIRYVRIRQDLIGQDRIEEWRQGWSDRERKECVGKSGVDYQICLNRTR